MISAAGAPTIKNARAMSPPSFRSLSLSLNPNSSAICLCKMRKALIYLFVDDLRQLDLAQANFVQQKEMLLICIIKWWYGDGVIDRSKFESGLFYFQQ
jgi:hypothetical protein